MKKQLLLSFALAATSSVAMAQAPAFPGAEGHGRYTTGGRGGKIVHVTNLNDSGTGSFRQAVSGSDKKIVVFDVGGVIALTKDLTIGANTTVLGQTAPAPGITLRYYTIQPSSNCVIRFIRSRRGQEKDVNDGADAIWNRHLTGVMIDHCSFSWSIDEVASFYDNNNFTMQWSTIAESLVNPGHSKGAHGYGGIWGGKLASFHHNLIAHVANRSPRFNGARYDWTGYTGNKLYGQYNWANAVQAENVDFRNCVVYNCGNGCYGGPGGGQINMVGNYYKTGPAGSTTQLTTVSVGSSGNASGYPIYWTMTSRYYLSGNRINNNANAGWSNVSYDGGTQTVNGKHYSPDPNHYYGDNVEYTTISGQDYVCIQLDEEAPKGEVTTHTADQAYEKVLTYAGSSLTQDEVDARYFSEARNGTATYTGSVTGQKGRIDLVSDVKGYTEANFGTGSRAAGFDTDKDGIPDAWETVNGLNPNNAGDALLYSLDPKKYYTNIEVYANSLVQDIMLAGNDDATESVEEYYPAYTKEDGTQVEAINGGSSDVEVPIEGIEGDIAWSMTEGTATPAYSFSSTIGDYLLVPQVSVGSHLKVGGTKTADVTETTFTIADESSDAGPTNGNAIKFTITPADGYRFQPTHVAFKATRFGTDHGKFQAYWLYDDNSRVEVAAEQLAQRDNQTPKCSTINTDIQAQATTAPSALVIHLYDIPYNTNTKYMGLGSVVVSGTVGSTSTAISEVAAENTAVQETYYNMQGMRLQKPGSTPYISVVRTADGKQIVRKVMR